jgi:hypothetical protein
VGWARIPILSEHVLRDVWRVRPVSVRSAVQEKRSFFESLLTAQSSWTYNDPADDAAVARHLRSASLEFLGHTATQLKNWVEDVSLLNASPACCLTIKSEERETWTARSLRDASLWARIGKRLWRSRLSSSSMFSGLPENGCAWDSSNALRRCQSMQTPESDQPASILLNLRV